MTTKAKPLTTKPKPQPQTKRKPPSREKEYTNKLRTLLGEHIGKMTLQQAEDLTGVSKTTISGFLCHENGVNFETVCQIVYGLGKSFTWLDKEIRG